MNFATIKNIFFPVFKKHWIKRRVKCHRTAKIFHADQVKIGSYVYIGPNAVINGQGGVEIGEGSIIGPDVVILSSSHDFRSGDLLPYSYFDINKPVLIGRGVWLGYRSLIVPGVNIGDGAVIGMGALVTKNVGEGEVVGGNPATVIGHRDKLELVRLLKEEAYFHRKYWSGPRPRHMVNKSDV